MPDKELAFPHTVSGQARWSHWHAISTSLAPASLQDGPQNLSPGCARHWHGRCPHLLCLPVVIIWISFLSSGPELAIRAAATFLSPLVSNSRPPKAVHNCSHFSESLAVRNYPETGFEEVGIEELIGTCGRKTSRHPRGCDGCVTPSVSWSLAMVTSYTRRST